MKRLLLFIVAQIFFLHIFAQDDVLFKMTFKPKLNYNQNVVQKFHLEMKYQGSDSLLKVLKDNGVQNPTISESKMEVSSVYKTGDYDNADKMPLLIELTKMESLDGKTSLPPDTKIYGSVLRDKMPVLDSVTSNGGDEKFKKQLLTTLQNLYSQVSFPDKKMSVGEEYTKKTPLEIPIGGMVMKMEATVIYKLKNVSNATANFDIKIIYAIKMSSSEMPFPFQGSGDGSGILVYDRNNEFPLTYKLDYKMNISAEIKGIDINMLILGSSITECTITKQ